jgi:hypothetical protein
MVGLTMNQMQLYVVAACVVEGKLQSFTRVVHFVATSWIQSTFHLGGWGSEFILKDFLWFSQSGDHPQGDFAKSGYKPNMKVQKNSIVLL